MRGDRRTRAKRGRWLPGLVAVVLLAGAFPAALAVPPPPPAPPCDPVGERLDALERRVEGLEYTLDRLLKKVDDVLWFERVGDVAEIDKVFIPTVPNPRAEETYGIANERHPFKMWAYVFTPRDRGPGEKLPLLLFPHGGVHGDFTTYYTHVVRELMAQGYVVVAPEYRGSTGYGREYQESIDYGGLEVDDVVAARDWAMTSSRPGTGPSRRCPRWTGSASASSGGPTAG